MIVDPPTRSGEQNNQIFTSLLPIAITAHPAILLTYAPALHKRVAMPSKLTIDEQRLIDGLSMGVITAFRSSVRVISCADIREAPCGLL